MDEYINKQQAIDEVIFGITYAKRINKETGEVVDLFQEGNAELKKAAERIANLPSADVVDVVRCRDCKYYEPNSPYDGWCHGWSGMTVDDGYCSYGERKDSEQRGTQ